MSDSTSSRSVYFFGSIAAYIWKCKVLNKNNGDGDEDDQCNYKTPHSPEDQQQLFMTLKASTSVLSFNEPFIEETFGAISSSSPLPLHSFECAPGASMRALFLPVLIEKAHCLSPVERTDNNNSSTSTSSSSDKSVQNEINSLTLNVALTLRLSSLQGCQSQNAKQTSTINKVNDDGDVGEEVKTYVSSLEESSTSEITKIKPKNSMKLIQCCEAQKNVKVKEIDVMSHNDECMLVKMDICYSKESTQTQDDEHNSDNRDENNKEEQELHAEVYIVLRVINLTSTMRLLLSADDASNELIYSESTELLASKLNDNVSLTITSVDGFPRLQYSPNNQICMDHSEYKNNKCSKSSLSYLSFGAIPLTELYRHYRLLCAVAFDKIVKHSDAVVKLLITARNSDSNNNKSEDNYLGKSNNVYENSFAHSLVRLSAQTRATQITSTDNHETNTQLTKQTKEASYNNPKSLSEEYEEESSVILQTFIAFRWDTLHSLSLERVMLGDNACAALLLTLSHCVNLQQFNGDQNELGDATCARLFALFKAHRTLQEISLKHNRIYDTGAWWILKLIRCNARITCVHLEHNPTSVEMMHHVREACDKNHDMRSCNVFNVFANQYNYLTSPRVLSNEIIHKATCVWSALVARTVGEIDVWVRNSTTLEFNQFVDETAAERKKLAESILQSEQFYSEDAKMKNIRCTNQGNMEEKELKSCEVNKEKSCVTMNTAIPRVARAPLLNEVIRTISNKINRTTVHPLVQLVFMDMVEALAIPGMENNEKKEEEEEEQELEIQEQKNMKKKNKKSEWERALAECVTCDRYYVSFLHLLITLMHGIVFEVNWSKVKQLLQLIGQYQRQLGVMPEDYVTAITAFMNALHVVFGVEQTKWSVTSSLGDHNNNENNTSNKRHSTKNKERTIDSNSTSGNNKAAVVVITGEINVNNNNNNNSDNNKDDILSGDYLAAFLMVLALGVRTAVLDI